MARRTLNWGIMGTAKIARPVAAALRDSRLAQTYAVASRNPSKAEVFAREFGFHKHYGNYWMLLKDPSVDVIYNPLPNHLHGIWTIRALESGKHVLCEKPLARNATECRRMIQAAKRNNRVLMEAFAYRVHPQTIKIQRLLSRKTIGDIRVVRAGFGFMLDEDSENVRLQTRMGGGCLMDIGCYCVNAIRTFFGAEPSSVVGHAEPGKRTRVDMNFAGTLIFPGGELGIFSSSFQTTLDREIEIIGTRGRIQIPSPWRPDGKLARFTLEVNGKARVVETRNSGGIYHNEVGHFTRCILSNKSPLLPPEDAWRNMIVIDALIKSAKSGRRTRITSRSLDRL